MAAGGREHRLLVSTVRPWHAGAASAQASCAALLAGGAPTAAGLAVCPPHTQPRPAAPLVLQPLFVYRSGKWGKLPGDALLPGDVVSITRGTGTGGPAHEGMVRTNRRLPLVVAWGLAGHCIQAQLACCEHLRPAYLGGTRLLFCPPAHQAS